MSQLATSAVVPIVKPSVAYVPVDPTTAQRWLNENKVNRSLRVAKVNQFANDMAAGRWSLSNDAICFAPDGTLLNGQHRLHAIVKSGVTITMLTIRNMPPESMKSMDIGTSRTAADALGFAGEKSAHLLAASGKLAIVYSDGRIYKDSKAQAVSPTEIQEFVDAHPLIRHSVSFVAGVKSKIDAAPSVLAAAHWIISEAAGAPVADHYLHQLAYRTGEPAGSAVLAVDSRLRQLRHKRSQYAQRAYLALLIKGWNYYARDGRITSLQISTSAKIPDPRSWQR
ncbi:MAG TPA: hypothetical protein VGE38_07475 [Nocardioides sp.]|uniref:hypothetical protein n=1 Tax=Nocardioides sp. TaxID=35761 RepID=UPI002ED85E87